jgi:SAM-dependent methyltransferase
MAEGKPTEEQQRELYERVYSTHDEKNQRWKALCAEENIRPIDRMLRQARLSPGSVIDVGCGDGAVLAEMSKRGLGSSFAAYEIAPSAVEYVAERAIPGVQKVQLFDGSTIPEPDGEFDLGLLHFVLDQALSPAQLLAETGRVSRHVFVSVIMDDTRRTRSRLRAGGEDRFGRLQLYNRASIREQILASGLEIVAEEVRAPGIREGVFWAEGVPARTRAYLLGMARYALHRAAPEYAQGLFGHSYRAICASPDAHGAAAGSGSRAPGG